MATADDAGKLSAYVVSPSQDQSDAIVQPLEEGRHFRQLLLGRIAVLRRRRDGAGNTVEENSSVFSRIRMR